MDAQKSRRMRNHLEDLEKERDFVKKLIDVSPTFFVAIDEKGKTRLMNTAMLIALGYTEAEVAGKDYIHTFVPPEEHKKVSGIFELISGSPTPTLNQNHVLAKDGRKLLVEWHGRPIFKPDGKLDFFFGVGIDITNSRRAEEALKESDKRFRELTELLPLTIYETDLKGNITYANQAAFNASGYSPEDLEKGLNVLDIIAPEDRVRARESIANILSGQLRTGTEYKALRKDGSRFPMVNYSNLIMCNNQPVGIRGIVVDITERKEAEEKEKRYMLHMMEAEKNLTLGTLVTGVAHEINNPNNIIMFNLPIVKEIFADIMPMLDERYRQSGDFPVGGIPYSKLPQSVERLLNGMSRSSERIKHIVANLRDFARPDPYKLDQYIQVNEVLQSSIVLLNNMIRISTDNFHVVYGENLPKIKGNYQRLEQVIINLIQNACQSLKDKEQSISVKTALFEDENIKNVRITVSDEGGGIPAKDLKFVTDPFFTTKRDEGGTGLGLSITHRIIKDHNGTLDIQSDPGRGSVFTVTLPVTPAKTSGKKRNPK